MLVVSGIGQAVSLCHTYIQIPAKPMESKIKRACGTTKDVQVETRIAATYYYNVT